MALSVRNVVFLPFYYAQDTRIFEKHGLYVELIQMRSDLQLAGLVSGEVDYTPSVGPAHVEYVPPSSTVLPQPLRELPHPAELRGGQRDAQGEGQDEGGVMNAIGHSLLEEMIYKDGQLLNPNLVDYRVPSFAHLPKDFETILVENHNGPGPFGAKGTGEGGLLPVAAAIGNAVRVATGVRFYDLPLTPEKVWRALHPRSNGSS